MHFDLVISGEGVHKTEKLMFGGGINYQVNFSQRKAIFWTCLVEGSEVNTYSPLSLFFWGDDNIGEPIRVMGLSNDIGLNGFYYLFFYDFQSFLGKVSFFLANRWIVRVGE